MINKKPDSKQNPRYMIFSFSIFPGKQQVIDLQKPFPGIYLAHSLGGCGSYALPIIIKKIT